MSYQPVSGIVPQYSTDDNELANGYYLKFYQANTTTPLSMATDSAGATLLVKCKLSSAGFPISNPLDNSTVFIPHVNANYRLVIYPTEADANANNTASALVNIPDVEPLVGNTVTTSTGTQTVATALDNRLVSQTAEDVAGTAALVDTGTAAGEVPLNSDLGTASTKDTGTAAGEVPLNSTLVPKSGGTFTGDIAAPKITASTGILFGTDTAAANTLDGYEEGSWTPTTSNATNMSSVSITGSEYTTIGNMVFAQLKGSFSVTSASSVRTFFVFTLPFNTENDSTAIGGGGRVRSSSNLELNPAVGDPNTGNSTQAFLTFISYATGAHDFQISIMYRKA